MFPVSPTDRYRQLERLTFFRLIVISGLLLMAQQAFWQPILQAHAFPLPVLFLFLGTLFALTLIYLVWLRLRRNLELLVQLQCAVDPLLVTVLVVLTGLASSPLHFLYGLAVLNTALLLGRREALLVAGMVVILSIAALSLATLLFHIPIEPGPAFLRRVAFHSVAFILTAFLGGALAERARGLHLAFEQQKDSLADLTVLHEQIIAAMPYGLISINNQGVIREINRGAEEILQQEAWRLVNRPLEEPLPAFHWALRHADSENVYLEFKDENRCLGLNITHLVNRDNRTIGSLLVIRDLSTVKQLEQDLAARDRLALTGRMAAGVAHEIRNPLASILSAAQMLAPYNDRERKLQSIILEEVSRLKQLTTDFLIFSRPPRPEWQVVTLGPFLQGLVEQLTADPRWGDGYALLAGEATAAQVLFDPGHLRQVFWNLLINAAQAAPRGSEVTITARRASGNTLVTVTDQGPGLEPNLLSRVQEPFFTTRSSGTGLGLSVVAQLMHLNNGTIRFENASGGGLRVLLTMESADGDDPDL